MGVYEMVSRLLGTIGRLLRLGSGPQDLPASWPLTIVLVAAFLLQNIVTGQQLNDGNAAAKSLLAVCLQIAVVTGLLAWRRCPERFTQTLSALIGVGIAFNLMTWGLLTQSDPNANQPVLAIAWFATFIWSLLVDANIYRHALSVTLSIGVLIAVLTLAANYFLVELFFMTL